MSRIHVLDKQTAELIAAGEVVERPSSVVKELLENAIDAGSSVITVEIQNGGVTLMRITDDGSGISCEDVPLAFLRHATSKVREPEDLEKIGTLGFRGEALASVCAVARVELLTRTEEEPAGTRYLIEGGEERLFEDAARARGTTITVRDLFYNVPARMKFLKKDVTEANAVAGVVDRIALSHPEISVRFLRDGKEELLTPGDGQLLSCIYTVFGRDFAKAMLPVDYSIGGIRVHGYVSRPSTGRGNRTQQHFFINGRYVRTRTGMAALEEAFKGSMMVGKFPACVLNVELPAETVDVNVHPAKIEVRFINERPLFDAVYHAVKSGIQAGGAAVEIHLPDKPGGKASAFQNPSAQAQGETPVQTRLHFGGERTAPISREIDTARNLAEQASGQPPAGLPQPPPNENPRPFARPAAAPPSHTLFRDGGGTAYNRPVTFQLAPDIAFDENDMPAPKSGCKAETLNNKSTEFAGELKPEIEPEPLAVRYLGEAFSTYILVQQGESLYIIDKHAAHERILYDRLKSAERADAQLLLEPVTVTLGREEYAALLPELDTLRQAGFDVEDFGGHSLLVRGLPMTLDAEDARALLEEIAGGLAAGRREIATDKLDWIYHNTACRAAIKGGDLSRPEELQAMAERVLLCGDVRTCPHGRPVCYELTRRELEKQFGRVK